ncbi:hypothetical protein [Candidatus Nitronereus thalassa]|uniref:Endonuclease n=1 Tax=Candidatus Nitronereus thalassa TaxID=3020898 RepID=A0ABU3K9J0_9BACT|nr:hypothetical protein [Candidatus Nitronereus thalassa]MDT7043076.1 hypothetical protein [Candidatus Nitronereus thalassa]
MNRQDEDFAIRFLKSHELQPKRYPGKDSKRNQNTPDFRVSDSNGYFFYCELKSVKNDKESDGKLHSTTHNNLTKKIHKAAEQFRSVNSKHLVPNVLVWFSHDCRINDQNLRDLLDGRIKINGKPLKSLHPYRYGRTNQDFKEIDLHIWLYPWGEPVYVFTPCFDFDTTIKLCRIFDIYNVKRL